MTRITYPSDGIVNYRYNKRGQIHKVTWQDNADTDRLKEGSNQQSTYRPDQPGVIQFLK